MSENNRTEWEIVLNIGATKLKNRERPLTRDESKPAAHSRAVEQCSLPKEVTRKVSWHWSRNSSSLLHTLDTSNVYNYGIAYWNIPVRGSFSTEEWSLAVTEPLQSVTFSFLYTWSVRNSLLIFFGWLGCLWNPVSLPFLQGFSWCKNPELLPNGGKLQLAVTSPSPGLLEGWVFHWTVSSIP